MRCVGVREKECRSVVAFGLCALVASRCQVFRAAAFAKEVNEECVESRQRRASPPTSCSPSTGLAQRDTTPSPSTPFSPTRLAQVPTRSIPPRSTMAPPSSDMQPPPPKEHGDTGRSLQQEHQQTVAPDSPATMSAARDIADDTGATTKKNLPHADRQPSKAKQSPILESPDDIASITDQKQLSTSTSISSENHSRFPDKATDGASPDPDSPRSQDLVSSANEIDSLDDPAGTRSLPEVTSHDGLSTSSGKTPLISTDVNEISTTNGDYAHGSNAASLGDNSQADRESDGTATSRPLKRKIATPSTDGKLPIAPDMQQSSKKAKYSTDSTSLTATQSAAIGPGSAVSISRPTTSTAGNYGNDSAVPTATTHTQTPTIAPSVPTVQTHISQISAIDHAINHFRQLCGQTAALWIDTTPHASELQPKMGKRTNSLGIERRMKLLNLTNLTLSIKKVEKLKEAKVCRWLASNDVLPTLDQFRRQCMENQHIRPLLASALDLLNSPWEQEAEIIASCAKYYHEIRSGTVKFNHPHQRAMMYCAKYVRRLARKSRPTIMYYTDECAIPESDRFLLELCARALLTAYFDYHSNTNGVFRTLFASVFVNSMTWQGRKSREATLGIKGAVTDAEYRTPSLAIHRAAGAFGRAMKFRTMKKTNNTDEQLLVTEPEKKMADRFTKDLKAFETEASSYPDLLLAVNAGLVVAESPESDILPNRIVDHKSVCTLGCKYATTPSPAVQDTFA